MTTAGSTGVARGRGRRDDAAFDLDRDGVLVERVELDLHRTAARSRGLGSARPVEVTSTGTLTGAGVRVDARQVDDRLERAARRPGPLGRGEVADQRDRVGDRQENGVGGLAIDLDGMTPVKVWVLSERTRPAVQQRGQADGAASLSGQLWTTERGIGSRRDPSGRRRLASSSADARRAAARPRPCGVASPATRLAGAARRADATDAREPGRTGCEAAAGSASRPRRGPRWRPASRAPRRPPAGSSSPRIARMSSGSVRFRTIRRALDKADLAVLLGDDDDDRVGLLGDPERGPVAGPEPLAVDGGLRQRQHGAGGHDPVVADDHRAVMERRAGHEDRARAGRPRRRRGSSRPVSATSSRPVSRSSTISAPWPSADSPAAARATSLATSSAVRDSGGESSQPNEPTRPIRSRARRSSGWKTTTSAKRPTTAPACRIWVSRRRSKHGQAVDHEQDADADDEPDGARSADQAEEPVDEERRDPDVDDRRQARPRSRIDPRSCGIVSRV